jgi:hypothetical protein
MFENARSLIDRDNPGSVLACVALPILLVLSGCGVSNVAAPPGNSLPAGPANSAGPAAAVLGYVWDSRVSGLRAVAGVAGAAHLETGTVGGKAYTSGAPCVLKDFALLASSAGEVVVMSLPSGKLTQVAVQAAPASSEKQRILLSPSCSKALIYSPASRVGMLVSGLPSSPEAHSLNFATSGSILGAAVSDTGTTLFATLSSDGSTAVHLLTSAEVAPQTLKVMQRYGAMAFMPGGDTALLADSATNVVTVATGLSESSSFTQLGSSAEGVNKPVAVAGSADGHYVFVANGAGGLVLRLDLSQTSAPATIACACTASELLPLAGNATFQLTDPAAGTIYALEGDAKAPRTVFIPTDKTGAANGGAQ